MIVSHAHRFIFVRTRKTASTSLEIALSRHAGPDDIVTSLCERDEGVRRQWNGRGPQNHLHPGAVRSGPTPPGPGPGVKFYNHMSAADIRRLVGVGVWRSYFTFCFDRNPWDKVMSLYYHRYRIEPRPGIRRFVESGEAADALNFPLYHDREGVAVDFLGRYEDLDAGVRNVFTTIGLPPPDRIPAAKAQFRPAAGGASFDAWSVKRVAEMYRPEIELLGYQPPSLVTETAAGDPRSPAVPA